MNQHTDGRAALVAIRGGTVTLDMGMTGRSFAQTKLLPFMEEAGALIHRDGQGKRILQAWRFSNTAEKDGFISVQGNLPPETGYTPLLGLLNSPDQAKKTQAAAAVCKAAETAVKNGDFSPLCGPACTLMGEDGSVLFLPRTLSVHAVTGRATQSPHLLGCWLNPGLPQDQQVYFLEAGYIYYVLTGALPYPEQNDEKRQADRYDGNYIPLSVAVPGCPKELASAADGNLTCRPQAEKHRRRASSGQFSKGCTALPVSEEDITAALDSIQVQDKQKTAAETARYTGTLRRRLSRIRFIRRYSGYFVSAAIILIISGLSAGGIISGRRAAPTVQGLASQEVVRTFYTGLDTLDISLMQAAASGDAGKDYMDLVTNMYVASKMREGMERIMTVTPAQWLYMSENKKLIPFGITRFKIDGTPATLDLNAEGLPQAKDNPLPIASERGNPVRQDDQTEYTVDFYFWNPSDTADQNTISKMTDRVRLQYVKNKWEIVQITRTRHIEDAQILDRASFAEIFTAKLADTGTAGQAAAELAQTYPWLPSKEELSAAKPSWLLPDDSE